MSDKIRLRPVVKVAEVILEQEKNFLVEETIVIEREVEDNMKWMGGT